MKHNTPYPQSQQSLVSILLAAGLIVSYNFSATLAVPGDPITMAVAGSSSPFDKSLSTPELDTTILWPRKLDEEAQKVLAAKITTRPGRASSSPENDAIPTNLNEIRDGNLLSRPVYDKIAALVVQACQSPSSFAHYISISATRDNLERLMHETIVECANAQAGEQAKTSNRRHIKRRKQSLDKLATLVRSAIDQNRLAFMQNALGCADDELRDLFFSNLLLTKENINRRHQELRQEFDPDKARWIPVMNQCTANELMTSINCCKDTLLQNLQTAVAAAGSKDTFYEEQGANFWAMAQDCRHAQKSEWHQLKIFTQADFAHLSKNASEKVMILKQLRREHATHAYEAYRACCRVADANYARLSQLRLRSSMALCLYTAGRYLEAQLYALGAMRLIFSQSQHATLPALSRAKDILATVQQGQDERNLAHELEADTTILCYPDAGKGEEGLDKRLDHAYSSRTYALYRKRCKIRRITDRTYVLCNICSKFW